MATAKSDPRIADVLAVPTPITGEADPARAKALEAGRQRPAPLDHSVRRQA